MSFDKYSDKAAEAQALIREFSPGKVEYWDYFKGDPEQALEAFCAMQDAAEEMGRMKAQDSAAPQDNVPGVSELPVLKTWKEVHEFRAALRAYGQRAVVVDQWQPIETAPRDGTLIILGRPVSEKDDRDAQCAVGRWHEEESDAPDNMGHDAGFMDVEFSGTFSVARSFGNPKYMTAGYQPTHWQPLPTPPGAAPSQPQQEAVPADGPVISFFDLEKVTQLKFDFVERLIQAGVQYRTCRSISATLNEIIYASTTIAMSAAKESGK